MTETVWMKPPNGEPEVIEVGEDTHKTIAPLMRKGWRQCLAPAAAAPVDKKPVAVSLAKSK